MVRYKSMPNERGQALLISFDTNAWSNLVGDGLLERAALIALRREVREDALQVAVTWPLLMEIAGLYRRDRPLWRTALRELRVLGKERILRERPARVQTEVRLGRKLKDRELFFPQENCRHFFDRAAAGENMLEEIEHVAGFKAEFEKEEIAAQEAVRRELCSKGRAEWIRAWRTDSAAIVLDWCKDAMVKILGRETGLPDARVLPSLWCRFAYHLARIYLVGIEAEGPGKIDQNDVLDHDHYADAAYSGVLVTDDRGLHRIALQCPEPKIRVVRFHEWASAIASG